MREDKSALGALIPPSGTSKSRRAAQVSMVGSVE
jgi:hypothetical protein